MNLSNHWNKVSNSWRHIISDITKDKKSRLISDYNKYFIENINIKGCSTALDWGCGGGLLTKELQKHFTTSVVDISKHSLDECEKYCNPHYSQIVPSNIDDFIWNGKNVDFILCHALVWHFPSLDYFKKVLSIWSKLSPKYIALNIKSIEGQDFIESSNYQKNYLQALLLSVDKIESLFNGIGYSLVFKKSKETVKKQTLTFLVFKKI